MAQPVPLRPVPIQRWGPVLIGAAVLFALFLGLWEDYWRSYGVTPSIANTEGLWAIQRRRIDAGEGAATVLLGASRVYFDIQLPVWERLSGRRPIQLSFEGTAPLPALEDLAEDPNFTGRLLIGVAPDVFFPGRGLHAQAARYARKQSPAQRIGQWLSMHFIEPYLAFDDPDYALRTVLARQKWPSRMPERMPVRKLSQTEADRNSYLWGKVETDPYRAVARGVWLNHLQPGGDDRSPQEARKIEKEQIDRTAAAVAKLHARGVKVLFVRMPSTGPYLEFENRKYPRARTWDALLAASHAPGIYFEDYPQLLGYELPEWSHLKRADAERFTAALYQIIERDFWGPAAPASQPDPGSAQ